MAARGPTPAPTFYSPTSSRYRPWPSDEPAEPVDTPYMTPTATSPLITPHANNEPYAVSPFSERSPVKNDDKQSNSRRFDAFAISEAAMKGPLDGEAPEWMSPAPHSTPKQQRSVRALGHMSATNKRSVSPRQKPGKTMADNIERGGGSGGEEKIFVTVRVRPLSEKELALRDVGVWQCPDKHTLRFMEALPERSPYPAAYHFDRVFGPTCESQQVYAEGAQDVVLSALAGVNASIFAYGMTSSGKTHTMKAVTELATLDIFEHIQNTPQREYMIRVSALEIYNEVVRDLLNMESGALRLLDDPYKGTVVEKLTEEVVRSSMHLRQILADCESQRQVGETTLNEFSSRSHQIVRLTVESCPLPSTGLKSSLEGFSGQVLTATLNFVDLAGSERASQTQAEGTRLKEGAYINRSLLTLSTVIRKLSGGNKTRSGHIPYRDSKLTRILSHSLGGNGRTAIICTLSPARTHVDQTRNTLSFATRAKEVTNTAHVNLMMSDKVLVKQLEREVARLQAELLTAPSMADFQAQRLLVQKLEAENAELSRQRNVAQVRLQEVTNALSKAELKLAGRDATKDIRQPSLQRFMRQGASFRNAKKRSPSASHESPLSSGSMGGLLEASSARIGPSESWLQGEGARERHRIRRLQTRIQSEVRKLATMNDEIVEDAGRAMEALMKEMHCLRMAQQGMNQGNAETLAQLQAEVRLIQLARSPEGGAELLGQDEVSGDKSVSTEGSKDNIVVSLRELSRLRDDKEKETFARLEEELERVQQSLDKFCEAEDAGEGRKALVDIKVSTGNAILPNIGSHKSPVNSSAVLRETNEENVSVLDERAPTGGPAEMEIGGMEAKEWLAGSKGDRRLQLLFKQAAQENIRSLRSYVQQLKERIAKLDHHKHVLIEKVLEMEGQRHIPYDDDEQSDGGSGGLHSTSSLRLWPVRFEREMLSITELWQRSHVSLVHRTQFYLLITGEPSDSIYLEVEQRRMVWMCEQSRMDDGEQSMARREKALQRERDLIARRLRARFTLEEREKLFEQWRIERSSKQRKLQLAAMVWTQPRDMGHVEASAHLVGLIMRFPEHGVAAKELLALQFMPPSADKKWLWKNLGMTLL